MSKSRIPSSWKKCATCSHWLGQKTPDMFCNYVEYDTTERARCAGGGFNNISMPGTSGCSKWTQHFTKR